MSGNISRLLVLVLVRVRVRVLRMWQLPLRFVLEQLAALLVLCLAGRVERVDRRQPLSRPSAIRGRLGEWLQMHADLLKVARRGEGPFSRRSNGQRAGGRGRSGV